MSLAPPAQADPKEECVLAHADGQREMKVGHISAARSKFALCVRDVCPGPIVNDCSSFLEAAQQAQPTVVLGAHDAHGRDATDVRVMLDGQRFAESVSARAVDVDPGEHVFRFVDRAGASVDVRVVVREGEKDRFVLADFPRAPAAPFVATPAPVEAPLRPWAQPAGFAIGGVGVATLGVFATFGIIATLKAQSLGMCAPQCGGQADEVHAMRTEAEVADITLAAGGALVTTGVVFLLLGRAKTNAPPARTAFSSLRFQTPFLISF